MPILLFDLVLFDGETLFCCELLLSVFEFTALLAERVAGVLPFLRASDRAFELLVVTPVDDLPLVGLATLDRALPYSLALKYLLGLALTSFLEEDLVET